MKGRSVVLILLAMLAGMVVVYAGSLITDRLYTFRGSFFDPPLPASDFELIDQHGNPFRMSDHRGQVVLIYFGYTNCPDFCPTTMFEFKQILERVGDQADEVVFLFITVDPEIDTRERIGAYLNNFHPTFIGLSGELDTLQAVWDDYLVFVEQEEINSALGYSVTHTVRVYVIDKNGDLRLTFPFGMETEDMIQDVLYLLRE